MANWILLAAVAFLLGFIACIALALKGITDFKFGSGEEFTEWIFRRDQ
jgi:hypothetical protein